MAKVIDIRDSESDSLFAVLLNVNNKYVAYGNTDRSKTFAKWFNNQDIDVSDLDSILPSHLFSSKPTVITSANSEYSNFIPTSILDSRENKVFQMMSLFLLSMTSLRKTATKLICGRLLMHLLHQ